MTIRVVQWSTGNVGHHALIGIDARPELELVGVFVSSDAKAGKDAGELAGLDRELGIKATTDKQALLDLKPDCIVHTAWADDRLMEAIGDLCDFLRAGINVVSSSPVFLQFPRGVAPDEMVDPIEAAAKEGGVSLFVNGIDPGFANDALALAITGISESIEQVRCVEIMNYDTYDQATVLFDVMGFARPIDDTPMLLWPGVLTLAWGSVVRQIAKGLDVELDEIVEFYERLPATETFEVAAGKVEEGTAAALHFEVRGMRDGRAIVVLEHVTRLHDDLAPDWPQPTGKGGYRVIVTGEPNYVVDLQMWGKDGDHNTAGLKSTAMRLVNSVEAVVAAKPGLITALELPQITGRGLVL
ncbi:MAG: hypothetical protein ACI867_001284 [Glaciecola sp.]|jgi:hypothetical protein